MSSQNEGTSITIGGFGIGSIILFFIVGYWFFGKTLDAGLGFVLFMIVSFILSVIPFVGFPIWLFAGHPVLLDIFGLWANEITALATLFFLTVWVAISGAIMVFVWVNTE